MAESASQRPALIQHDRPPVLKLLAGKRPSQIPAGLVHDQRHVERNRHRLALSGPNDRLPLNVLAVLRAGDGFSDHMPISSKAREQLAAPIGAVRPVEQLGRCLIDPLDDPLDRRLDNLGNGSASAPALLSTLPAGFEFGGLSLVNKIVDRVGGVLHVLL